MLTWPRGICRITLLIALTSAEVRDERGSCADKSERGSLRLRSGFIAHVKIAPMAEAGRTPAARFSDRAEDYVKYRRITRPKSRTLCRKPAACGPSMSSLTSAAARDCWPKIFLDIGNHVIGVEPNPEMRVAGEEYLAAYPNFTIKDGQRRGKLCPTPASTLSSLARPSTGFNPSTTRTEFARILKPGGWAVLIWHDRNVDSTPFLRAYEDFVRRHSIDYEQVAHKYVATYAALEEFFAPNKMMLIQQHNQQRLDFDGLRGRLLSSSYIPKSGERYEALSRELPDLFSSHAANGHIVLQYDTKIYFGHLDQ